VQRRLGWLGTVLAHCRCMHLPHAVRVAAASSCTCKEGRAEGRSTSVCMAWLLSGFPPVLWCCSALLCSWRMCCSPWQAYCPQHCQHHHRVQRQPQTVRLTASQQEQRQQRQVERQQGQQPVVQQAAKPANSSSSSRSCYRCSCCWIQSCVHCPGRPCAASAAPAAALRAASQWRSCSV
jgi:hypothetical protein